MLFLLLSLSLLAAGGLGVSGKVRLSCFIMPLALRLKKMRIQKLCEEVLISDLLFP